MSRPSKLTPQVEAVILDALRAGNTRTAAAESAGLPRETLSRWIARFVTFRHAVKSAEAQAQTAHVANITQAANSGVWTASAWWLERRYPDEWGKTERIEIQVRRAAERVAAQTGADPDWLVKRAAEIAEAESGAER